MVNRYFLVFLGLITRDAFPNVDPTKSAIYFPYENARVNTPTPYIVAGLNNSLLKPVSEPVTITINGQTIGSQTPGNGIVTYLIPQDCALADGAYSVTVECQSSQITLGPNSFVIDTRIPAVPIITFPSPGAAIQGPMVTVTGTCEDGAAVFVTLDDWPFADIIIADAQGNWSITYPLSTGSHTVMAQIQNTSGNVSPCGPTISFTV